MSRISTIASLVPVNSLVYDLCCDHGLIGQELMSHSEVVFVDIVPEITTKLKFDNVINADILDLKIPTHATIIIAGVGAKLIGKFLMTNKSLQAQTIIAAPHNSMDIFYELLSQSSYKRENDLICVDKGRVYEIFVLTPGESKQLPINKQLARAPQAYLKKQIEYLSAKNTQICHKMGQLYKAYIR